MVRSRRMAHEQMSIEVHQHGKYARQGNPKRRPTKRLSELDDMRLTVQHTEVEHQHHQDENVEADPEWPVSGHRFSFQGNDLSQQVEVSTLKRTKLTTVGQQH